MTGPLDDRSGPDTFWTTVNAAEALPGVPGAILARELGVACVFNSRVGTAVLRTGDLLRVDGGAGVVTVLEPGSA